MGLGWGRGRRDNQKSSEKSLDEFLSEGLGKRLQGQGTTLLIPFRKHLATCETNKHPVFFICGKMRESAAICGCNAESVRRMAGSAGKCGNLRETVTC